MLFRSASPSQAQLSQVNIPVHTSSEVLRPLVVVCPGLRTYALPGAKPDILVLNPNPTPAYGPTGMDAEETEENYNVTELYATPTLNDWLLLLEEPNVASSWHFYPSVGQLTKQEIRPLPSFLHLPCDAFKIGRAHV